MVTSSGRCRGPGCGNADCVACSVYAWIEQMPAPPDQEPIKLTAEQWTFIQALYPQQPDGRYRFGGDLGSLYARRVHLVDDPADSFFASSNATYPQVASHPDPARGWLARVLDRLLGRTT